MSHWAEIDENNIVLRVIVGNNEDPNGDEGYQWLVNSLGGRWIQTSYNSNFRNKFAGIGDSYDEEKDIFIPAKPFTSWVFDAEEIKWNPPFAAPEAENSNEFYIWDEETNNWTLRTIVAYPSDDKNYEWDEATRSWVEVQ